MAYGETMKKLSPCDSALVLGLLRGACGAPPRALLDAGCGRGERLKDCRTALPETRLCGIDSDAENVRSARKTCPDAEVVRGDVCALPWADGSFDAALCECVLSLVDAPERCLSELHRTLRPGGILLLSDLCTARDADHRTRIASDGAVRYLAARGWIETRAEGAGFAIRTFRDCREEYRTMAAQMILDGSCGCVSAEVFAALRRSRAGYGLWILERSGAR